MYKNTHDEDKSDNKNALTPFHSGPGPMQEAQRVAAKQMFLEMMGRANNITHACRHAGISRPTVASWQASGFLSDTELAGAYAEYQDSLRAEITKRAIVGIEKPLIQNGRLVYDRNGEPVTTNQKSERLLLEMARHTLPEYARLSIQESADMECDIPKQYRLVIDVRQLTTEELQELQQIGEAIEYRQNGIVNSQF